MRTVPEKILLLLFCSLAAGCVGHASDGRLPAAEALIRERPDSVLQLLSTADTATWNAGEKARRRVLLSQAYNRLHVRVASDSLIRPALAYYRRRGTHAEKAQAWYYYGTVHENAKQLDEAVKGYSTALHHTEKAAGDPQSDRLRAVIYHTLGALYTDQGFAVRAEAYFDRAARLSGESGNDEERMFSLLMKSTVLYQQHRYREAIDVLRSIREEAARSGNAYLASFVETYLIHYHVFAEDRAPRELLVERNRIDRRALVSGSDPYSDPAGDNPLQLMYDILSTILFHETGQVDSAACYLNRSLAGLTGFSSSTAGMLRIAASVALMQGKTDSAYYYEQRYGTVMDSIYKAERTQQVSELEERYRNRYEMGLLKTRHRYQLWIFILVALLLLGAVGWSVAGYRRRLRRRDEQLSEYLALVESYRESHEGLTSRLRATDERETAVKELLEGRFAIIREIAATYYLYGETRRLSEKMKELALSPAMLADVVRMSDLYNDNAVTRLEEQLAGWTPRNYQFAALVIAGFSPQEISVMLGMTLNGVYTLKSKLKRRIAESGAQDKAFFIRFFD